MLKLPAPAMDSRHSTSESESDDALEKLWVAKAHEKADLNSFADAAAPAQSVADAASPAQNYRPAVGHFL